MKSGNILKSIEDRYGGYITESRKSKQSITGGRKLKKSIRSGSQSFFANNVGDVERKYLIVYDKDFPNFPAYPISVLRGLPIPLTKLLQVQVTQDHEFFWGWTAQVLNDLNRKKEIVEDVFLRYMNILFHLALGDLTSPPVNERIMEINRMISRLVDKQVQSFFMKPHIPTTQYSIPILEGLVKRMIKNDISIDGTVKKDGKVLNLDRGEYYSSGKTCSSIRDLLYHLEKEVSNSQLRNKMEEMRSEIAEFIQGDEGEVYGAIGSWRNEIVHGEKMRGSEYGIILNLICLLIWDQIDEEIYEKNWEETIKTVIFESNIPTNFKPHSFYPP